MAAVTNGIRISFANTPQARDDQFTSAGLTEDSLGVKYLDVIGNDLGGNAKTLYSLDDGISAGGSSPTDLLDRDAVGAVNTSALGAKIWITADGRVAYDASQIQAQFQYLAAGEYATDSFTYAIQLGNGALSWATATVRIAGANDAPVISSQPADAAGAVQEDTTLIAAGTLAATDVDHNATQAWSVQGSAAGAYGAIAVDGATGNWTYTLANDTPAVQALAANESHDETFTVRVTDDQSATAEQFVTVKVTGANDAPVVSGTVTGTATEDGAPSVLNALANASDVDNGTTLTVANANLPAGVTYDANAHSFTLDPSNAAYQSLAAGATEPVSVNYSVSDGITSTPATASWTVTGVNDAPVIGLADATGAVTAMPATPVGAPTPIVFTVEQFLGHQSNNLSELRNYAAAHQPDYTVQTNVIDYTDDPGGFAGELPGSFRWPAAEAQNVNGTGATVNNNFFARITADFSVGTADTYTFRTFNDDGVFLLIDNNLVISDTGYHPEIAFNGSIALAPGNHSIELFFFENGGEASLEFSARNSTGTFGLVGANGGGLGGAQAMVTDSGAIGFSDVDLTDVHLVSANPVGSVLGALTVEKNSDTTGTGAGGQLTWKYEVPNSAIEYLAAGQTKLESFTVTLDDQHGGVITRQVDVTVTGINDAPVISSSAQSGSVTEAANNSADEINDVVHQATGTLAFGDVDLTDAHTVSVNGNATPGYRGTLSASIPNPSSGDGSDAIAWTFAVADGALDDLAQGQVLIQTYSIEVDDGYGGTASRNVVITLTGAADNTPPVAFDDNVTTNEDVPVTFGVVGNDNDVDGQTLSAADVSALSNPALGTLQNLCGGQFGFNPTANASGTTSFTYQANDGQANSGNTATVTITVNAVNDAPVAVNDTNALTVTSLASQLHTNTVNWVNWTSNTVSATENIGGTIGAIGTVSGTIDVGSGQSIGVTYSGEYQFAQTDGATTGTPPGYPYGSIEHYYYTGTNVYTSASVANAPPDSDIIALNFATQTRTLTFSEPVENLYFAVVSMNNNGYVFDQDFQVVNYGQGYFGNGTLTRVDNQNGTYTVSGTGEPHGVLSINGSVGKLTWTSAANEFWNGFTVGTYGKALTGTATGDVLANDSDVEHDTLSVTAVNNQAITGNSITLTLSSGATLNVNKDGTYLYDENGKFGYLGEGQTAQEAFQYTVTDSHGASSAADVTITLSGVNDAPVAVDDIASTNEDNAVTIAVLANDTDPDAGDSKTLDSVAGAQHGTVAISGSNLVYTPSANYNGADSLTYTMKDAAGAQSTATVNVTVNPVSDAYTLSNLAVNGSFEQFGSGNTSTGSTAITGWTVIGSDVDRVAASGWQPGDGTYSLDLNGFHPGGVQQGLQTTPGVQYTVGFDLSKNPGNTTYATVKVSVDDTNQTSQSYSFGAGNSSTNMMWSQQTFAFTATGTTTALGFASTYPTDSTGGFPINARGPALDEVVVLANKVINDFTTGTGGDVLQLHDLLTSIGAPHDGTAISAGYLGFAQSGSDTLVQIDPNGGGDAYMTVATLIGVSDQLDASNYVL